MDGDSHRFLKDVGNIVFVTVKYLGKPFEADGLAKVFVNVSADAAAQ